jgi:teichuronic acid biosynthesis glycosyltransferase TuaG
MSSRVSVIIPTWNRAGTLAAAVTSALNQTHPPLEVLVCDDGSTDDSRGVVESLGDPRVRWSGGPRAGGPAAPRNRGVRESRGEWLAFLDSDDEWLPEKLERQLSLASRLGCRAACSNAYRAGPEEARRTPYLSWEGELVSFNDLLLTNQVICSSAVIHRSLLGAAGGFPEEAELTALEDYALWLRAATLTDFAYVGEPLLIYRDDPSASLRKGSPDVWTQRRIVFDSFLRWADGERGPGASLELYREAMRRQCREDARRRRDESGQGWRASWRARRSKVMAAGARVKRLLFR